jgi:phage/plasmid-associated DNA primase
MDFIRRLVDEKYLVFNVNNKKCPVNKHGNKMGEWSEKTYEELKKEHNYEKKSWGINLGEQPNGSQIMSLDFDCWDNKKSVPCEETIDRYEKYLEEFSSDGNYKSSTDGNGNVLLDITASDAIKNCIKNNSVENKFNLGGLEILVGKNQVIPPTQTTCKKTKKMGQARQFKNPEKPFFIVKKDSKIETYVLNLFEEKYSVIREKTVKVVKNVIPSTPCVEKNTETAIPLAVGGLRGIVTLPVDKHLDLLFNVIRNDKDANGDHFIGMDDWLKIAGILKSNKYGLSVLQQYTGDGNPKTKEIWDGFGDKPYSIYGLNNIAKKINPIGYSDWLTKWNQLIPLATLERGEKDIADFIKPFLINELKYCNSDWWHYNNKLCIWSHIDDPTYIFTNAIQEKINETYEDYKRQVASCGIDKKEKMDSLNKIIPKIMKFYQQSGKGGFTSQIKKFLMVLLAEADFTKCLDNGLYRQVYQNGVLNLKTMKFRQGLRYDDFVSRPIPFDYEVPTMKDIMEVYIVLRQICNWNREHYDYGIGGLGYAMTGDSAKEQAFYSWFGPTASNGKSLVLESLMRIIPQYVGQSENTFLDKGADIGKVIAGWGRKKILWTNELSKKKKDAELLKSIADGTSIKYKQLYTKKEQTMEIGFKLFTVSNNSLNADVDEGVARRLRVCEFNSQFKDEYTKNDTDRLEFPRDKDLMNKLTGKLKHAYLHLIYKKSMEYYIEKGLKPYPAEWVEESKQVIEDNDVFKDWFEEHCKIGEGLAINKKALEQKFKTELTGYNLKDELKKFKAGIKYDSQKQEYNDGKRFKGFWTGFGLKEYNRFGEKNEEQSGI